MSQNKLSYSELERKCRQAESALAAIRSGQADVIFGEQGLLLLRLQEAEKALRESEAKFKYVFERSNIGKSITMLDGTIQPNQTFADMLGYTMAELFGKKWTEITIPDDIPLNEKIVSALISGEIESARFHKRYLRKSGAVIWADIFISILRDDIGEPAYYITNIVNISELKQAEAILKRYEMAVKQTRDGIAIFDNENKLTFVNQAWAGMHGYQIDEMINNPLSINHTPAQMEEEVQSVLKEVFEKGEYHGEVGHVRKDGQVFLAQASISVIKDELGKPVGMVDIAQDITERKLAENMLNAYTLRLEQSNRDLQEFAYVASHDLQEPLRKIHTFSDRLMTKYRGVLDETGTDYLDRMNSATRRMQTLLDDLLAYSRVTTRAQSFELVDLMVIAREVISNLELRPEVIHWRIEVNDLPTVEADPNQMYQLFQNLIGNAVKFHLPERSVVIDVLGQTDGKTAVFLVKDNGIGFDIQYLDRIFKPFQRLHTRDEYEGTGIGLAICRRIVERHHGEITAESAPGQGATFIVKLPVHQPHGEQPL